MNIFLLLAHPHAGSFNHAIAAEVAAALTAAGHTVRTHDICAEGFNPLLFGPELAGAAPADPLVAQHMREIAAADGIVVVHPNWWGAPPAILKGWLDRVLRKGLAYDFGPGGVRGLLPAKAALVFTTSNTPDAQERTQFGDPLENFWQKSVWGFCGVKNFRRRNFSVVVASTPAQRASWLAEARELAQASFPAA